MKRALAISLGLVLLAGLPSSGAAGLRDVRVTGEDYIRHDGGTDPTIESCGSDATTPEPGGDAGGRAPQNEPTVAINPQNPDVVVAGANDYCVTATEGNVWLGFYVSTDGGDTWLNSLNPGYPLDSSAEGRASPVFDRAGAAGDPLMDWDNEGRLFYGGISFNPTMANPSGLVAPSNGDVIVSTWRHDPDEPLAMDHRRTVIVGEGTPSAFFTGRFNDKPSLRVDDWENSPHEGTVYVAWSLFVSGGQNQILFARSTNHGRTFSRPIRLDTREGFHQGSAIAVAPDGTLYVVWRRFAGFPPTPGVADEVVFVKSTDGGRSFIQPKTVSPVVAYDRRGQEVSGDFVRSCGDGPFLCESGFVFHRVATLPQTVADADGTVHVTWEEVVPARDNGDTYLPDGQARVVVTRSSDGGGSWATPTAVDPQPAGHQWWPNIEFDKSTGTLALIYVDSREDSAYSVHRPPGNRDDGTSACGTPVGSAACDVLNAFMATSGDGGDSWSSTKVSSVGHQPEYEMFGDADVPFHGDYLWVDAVAGRIFGVWVDNRDVAPGEDVRESVQDGFDVRQCRADAESPNTCPNAGGGDQNIYGRRLPRRVEVAPHRSHHQAPPRSWSKPDAEGVAKPPPAAHTELFSVSCSELHPPRPAAAVPTRRGSGT